MDFTEAELEAYLEETLNHQRAAELEKVLREDEELLRRLSHINARRDAGIHSLGEIWRRNQVGVPTPQELRDYLLGISSSEQNEYIQFRTEILKCPFTIAGLQDLQSRQENDSGQGATRRRKYFDSSAGLLRKNED